MPDFKIHTKPDPDHDFAPSIEIHDDPKMLGILVSDIEGDRAFICLEEPKRSEFIRKIAELETAGGARHVR